MPTIRLTVEYEGTAYCGWQRQAAAPTIQLALENAIAVISREAVTVIGAGRTDAGVHALAQTAHFVTGASLAPEAWRRALNAVLPDDIAIIDAETVRDDFHARFSALSKAYRYTVLNRPSPSPMARRAAWHLPRPLHLAAMRRAAVSVVGCHDFAAFRAADPTHAASDDTMCRLSRCTVSRRGDLVTIDIEGHRFLKYMVRNIVGTLAEVGLGKRRPGDVRTILESRDRRNAGVTAPPYGLTLVAVTYPESDFPR